MDNGSPHPQSTSTQTHPAARSTTGDYHVYHDASGPANMSTTVIHALADVMGRDVTDAGLVLYDYVDPDAIDRLFRDTDQGAPGPAGHIAFAVDGYQITVYSTGHIVITPPGP